MPILVDNFSIGAGEWEALDNVDFIAVDVIDHTYPVVTSGTYFLIDSIQVPTTHSGIVNGYRCYHYNPSLVSSGVIDVVIHAENSNNEVMEKSFPLLYGYHCVWTGVEDWGINRAVIVTIDASNEVICPNNISEAFYFVTKDLDGFNLGASLNVVEGRDLSAVIYPQSTFFFYNRSYTVTISGVRDFEGNEAAPVSFSFKIQAKP